MYEETFGPFLKVFHIECKITIVRCQGYNTCDPRHEVVNAFISRHNCYLTETTVLAIENLSRVDSDIFIDMLITSIAKDITRNSSSITL